MRYVLKAASDTDKEWLDALRRAVYKDLFDVTWGDWDEDRHERHFTACLEEGNISLIIVDTAPVGMIQLLEADDAVEIAEIQIGASQQGKGLATAIINDVLAKAHTANKKVTLSTGLKNFGAIKLYLRLGFVETDRTDAKIYMQYMAPLASHT